MIINDAGLAKQSKAMHVSRFMNEYNYDRYGWKTSKKDNAKEIKKANEEENESCCSKITNFCGIE